MHHTQWEYDMNEVVRQAYDDLAERYDQEFTRPIDYAEDQVVFYMMRGCHRPFDKVLDLGCGTGLYLEHLYTEPEFYRGVDISSKMLKIAESKFPKHAEQNSFICGDIKDFPYEVNTFNLVVSTFASLSYLPGIQKPIFDAFHTLKRNGRIFVQVYGKKNPRDLIQDVPIKTYSPDDLIEAAELAGFVDVKVAGLTVFAHKLPLSREWLERWLRFEQKIPWLKRWAIYLILTGRKP